MSVPTRPAVPMLFVEVEGVPHKTPEDLGRPWRGPFDIEVHEDAVERLRVADRGGAGAASSAVIAWL